MILSKIKGCFLLLIISFILSGCNTLSSGLSWHGRAVSVNKDATAKASKTAKSCGWMILSIVIGDASAQKALSGSNITKVSHTDIEIKGLLGVYKVCTVIHGD